jgi:hypothetical protein
LTDVETNGAFVPRAAGSGLLSNFVAVGVVLSLALTFFHPALWLPTGAFVGLAFLVTVSALVEGSLAEPARTHLALFWTATAVLLALVHGASEQFYNIQQIAFLLIGLLTGYLISRTNTPAWAAWTPFTLLTLYFSLLALLGRDPAQSFPGNSRNYVSALLIALYASAMLMSKARQVRPFHVLAALLTVGLSVWGTGRAGILASLLLAAGLIVQKILHRRFGVVRTTLAVFALMIVAITILFAAEALQSRGYLDRFASRGFSDAPRLSILVYYFYDINVTELLFGKNYYHDTFMQKWGFNLHNSYLSVWAHLGLCYLLLVLTTFLTVLRKRYAYPAMCVAVLAFAFRALTDTHLLSGQFDYIVFAALFMLSREPPKRALSASLAPLRT